MDFIDAGDTAFTSVFPTSVTVPATQGPRQVFAKFRDPAATVRQLADGHHFGCPWDGCVGSLGPWGSARTRPVRLLGGGTDSYTPKRAICRAC